MVNGKEMDTDPHILAKWDREYGQARKQQTREQAIHILFWIKSQ